MKSTKVQTLGGAYAYYVYGARVLDYTHMRLLCKHAYVNTSQPHSALQLQVLQLCTAFN